MRTLLLTIIFTSQSVFAARGSDADLNPTGKSGSGQAKGTPFSLEKNSKWKPEWSEAFFKCAEQMPEAQDMFKQMSNGEFTDLGPGKRFCQNSDVFKPENTRLLQLAMFKELVPFESGYKEDIVNPNKKGNVPNPPATGLFQIGPSDVEQYKCKTPEGKPMNTGKPYNRKTFNNPKVANADSRVKDLKVGKNNICCALKISATLAKKKKFIASNKDGTMGKFWEPIRVQKSDGAHGEKYAAKVNNVCKNIGQSGNDYFTVAENEAARRMPASANTSVASAGESNGAR